MTILQEEANLLGMQIRAGLNDGLFSETMDFRDFPSVLSAVRIAQNLYLAHSLPIV